jgi:hypothetical protein
MSVDPAQSLQFGKGSGQLESHGLLALQTIGLFQGRHIKPPVFGLAFLHDAAMALPALPAVGMANLCMPNSFALDTTIASPRTLNVPVGL